MHYNTFRYYERVWALRKRLGNACARCGSRTLLQFHHKDPAQKSFVLTSGFSRPWAELVEEADKCELRCRSCHKKEHAARHGLGMYTHYRCRCDICKEAWNAACRRYKATAKAKKQEASSSS